ncbi:MAG TPA: hypothetical protein VIC85_19400, partial [Ktedonobacterales bacterium]
MPQCATGILFAPRSSPGHPGYSPPCGSSRPRFCQPWDWPCSPREPRSIDRSIPLTTTYTYDGYGNATTTDDPDAQAGVAGHTGCAVNGTNYTACAAY